MAEKHFDKAYLYNGQFYGPGKQDVPDSELEQIMESETLSEEFKAALEGDKEAAPAQSPDSIDSLESLDAGQKAELKAHGYKSVEDLKKAKNTTILNKVESLDEEQLKAAKEEGKSSNEADK